MRAVLDASALLLERDGIRGLSTNTVARVAGVSVGSLYQYFPDAKAIVAELARGLEATALVLAAEEAVRLRDASARELTARVAALGSSPRFGTGKLRRILLREVPRGWILRESRSTNAVITSAITAFFALRPEEVRPRALERAVFVAQHAIEGLVEAVLLADPEALTSEPVERELFHLAWAYLAGDGEILERPPGRVIDAAEQAAAPDAALAERLVREPSRRREARERACSARALGTRRALLDAAEHVLSEGGVEALTVRAVVAGAGCSIGAFYRHFASPMEAAAEVAVEHERRAAAALERGLAEARSVEALASALVDAYANEHGAAVRRALLAEIPRRSTDEAAAPVLRAAVERLARALASTGELRAGDLELMAFVALHAVKVCAEAYLLFAPEGMGAAELREELRELVRCYWLRPTSGRARRPRAAERDAPRCERPRGRAENV